MLNLIWSLVTAAGATVFRAQPLFVSIASNHAVVRVHDGGQIGVFLCPVPPGPAPDLTFSRTADLAQCQTNPLRIADTPEALKALDAAFTGLMNERVHQPLHSRGWGAQAAALGVKMGAATSLAYIAITSAVMRGLWRDIGPVGVIGLHAALGAAVGVVITKTEYLRLVTRDGLRVDLYGAGAGLMTSDRPVILNVRYRTMVDVHHDVLEAMKRLGLPAAR